MSDQERIKQLEATVAVLMSDVNRLSNMVTTLSIDVAHLSNSKNNFYPSGNNDSRDINKDRR